MLSGGERLRYGCVIKHQISEKSLFKYFGKMAKLFIVNATGKGICMHPVVLFRLWMIRSSQVSVKSLIPLSLLLGALLSVANLYAQDSEQSIPDNTTAPGVSSNPDKFKADQDLLDAQQQRVSRAIEYARELDFESAERILEDASSVPGSRELIEDAREEIAGFRVLRAEELRLAAVLAMDAGNFKRVERILIELIALGGADTMVNQLRRRMEEARVYGGFRPGQVIRDQFLNQDRWTPSLVVILAGSFMMGSPATEKGRKDNEGPQHRVTFSRGFAMGQHEVTVSEFRDFVDQAGYKTDAERHRFSMIYDQRSGRLPRRDDVNWKMNYEGRAAGDDDPVVHVSWRDAQAYVNWLAQGTGKPYRLPSEAEFEYALRGGKSTRYWWGRGAPRRVVENITGEGDISPNHRNWSTSFRGYTDHFWGPAPVGSFEPSPYGLFDIGGNVGEWVMDCWHDTYMRAPVDGSGWVNPGCKLRVIRGGYWASSPEQTRSAFRLSAQPDSHDARIGFRVARDL
jgi:formylglycine-generating enzyme required for sulfatase activity